MTFVSSAQSQAEMDDPLKVVNNLFLAMETTDTTLAAKCFTDDAMLYTVTNGKTHPMPASKLVSAFGPKEDKYQEPIWNEVVQIDGNLATVWVDYAFFLNGTFSHCGVDAFMLVNTADGWKIFLLADTRRKADCDVPEEIMKKYSGG